MPNRVDLAEVSEIPEGHLPITKKNSGIVPYWSWKGQKALMRSNNNVFFLIN